MKQEGKRYCDYVKCEDRLIVPEREDSLDYGNVDYHVSCYVDRLRDSGAIPKKGEDVCETSDAGFGSLRSA